MSEFKDYTSKLFYFAIILEVCWADPDLFEKDCSHVVCNHDNRNSTCCFYPDTSDKSQKSSLDSSMVVMFFMAVTGSLLLLITIMYFSARMNRKCTDHQRRRRQRRRGVSTSSAGVQTTHADQSTLPPPYIWSTESSNQMEISIPRCPSYVKDPPQYGTWIFADKHDTSDNTNDADSHHGIEMTVNTSTSQEPESIAIECPTIMQGSDNNNIESNTVVDNNEV